ncbi:hypothetical protein EVAR_36602_1 [Eumeta japonica]|uniref:Uncharacterized protein n=1 Tax=Eumeta variegata TaxID=151549 RepID=A0A4C1ZML2_EUMVA|nr:hypothetical protein EVAR_36602_1 [Eumeta japonica]
MMSHRQCDEDGRLSDRPTTYHATEVKTPRTVSGMADQVAIFGRTDRSLHVHGCPGSDLIQGLNPLSAYLYSTSMVCTLFHIIEKEVANTAEHHSTDDRGSGAYIARRMYKFADQDPMNSSGTLHQCTRGRREADRFQEKAQSSRLPQLKGEATSWKVHFGNGVLSGVPLLNTQTARWFLRAYRHLGGSEESLGCVFHKSEDITERWIPVRR